MEELYSTHYLALRFCIDTTHSRSVRNMFIIFQPIWAIFYCDFFVEMYPITGEYSLRNNVCWQGHCLKWVTFTMINVSWLYGIVVQPNSLATFYRSKSLLRSLHSKFINRTPLFVFIVIFFLMTHVAIFFLKEKLNYVQQLNTRGQSSTMTCAIKEDVWHKITIIVSENCSPLCTKPWSEPMLIYI